MTPENTQLPVAQADRDAGFAPCPLCKQYSHSLGEDQLADAFMHFQSMFSHRGDGIPTQHNFDETTRDAAQLLMAAARIEHTRSLPGDDAELVARFREELATYPINGSLSNGSLASYTDGILRCLHTAGGSLSSPLPSDSAYREALKQAALDLHEAAGRFMVVGSKADPKGCCELTREAARRADEALTKSPPAPQPADQGLVERIARIINPWPFRDWQRLHDYCVSCGDSEDEAQNTADQMYGPARIEAETKAKQILAALGQITAPAQPDAGLTKESE
jgi:hypothetical protein